MKTQENIISFETAKLLKEFGYTNGGFGCYCQYSNDYSYDGDSKHPESHTSGEVRIYDFYFKNNDYFDIMKVKHNSYEIPTLSQIQKWLINVYGVAVLIDLDCALSWIWKIIPMDPGACIQKYSQSPQVWCGYNEIDVCLEDGILKCLSLIKENYESKF